MSDLISRQGAIDAWDKLSKRGRTEFDQVLMTLPSAEPKTKCIAQIKVDRDDIEDLVNEKVNEIVNKISEPNTGYWYIREYEYFTCSECGEDYWNGCDSTAEAEERLDTGDYPNFCPNCGARMIEKDDEA